MKFEIINGSITLGNNTILEEINFKIKTGDKLGIVGNNGVGKTTLLKGLLNPNIIDEGTGNEPLKILNYQKVKFGILEQIKLEETNTLLEEIQSVFKEQINLENKIKELENNLDTIEKIEKYEEIKNRYTYIGGYTYKKEYETMIAKFGFSEEDKHKYLSEFSGGQKTKIGFMKLLLSHPDILLLDEPTNHLDIKTIEWLETYLKSYINPVVIVSHDRMFLNHIVNGIYEIEYGTLTKYVGSYEDYCKEKTLKEKKLIKDYEEQQKEIARLKSIYERFRSKPTKAKMALSKLKQIEKMVVIEKPKKEDTRVFKTTLDKIIPSKEEVLKLKKLQIGYEKVLSTIDYTIHRGDRIGVIGENGTGKSTLLKTIASIIPALGGKCLIDSSVTIGYFDQNLKMISDNNTVLEEFQSYHKEISIEESRSILGSFLFRGDDVFKKVKDLSGGEKVRLSLCKILYDLPNFLILDEPTNHLDIKSKTALENILKKYTGTILFVSHDRYFVKEIATSLIEFTSQGINYYPYDYETYLEKKAKEEIQDQLIIKKETSKKEQIKKDNNNKKEINKIEKQITKLEKEITELKSSLEKEEIYTDYLKSSEIKKLLETKENDLDNLLIIWEKQQNNE